MIVGIGVDIVSVERFTRHARQSSALLTRLFRDDEVVSADGRAVSWHDLAARFAAKEAAAKALGVPRGFDWHDFAISLTASGQTSLDVTGLSAREATRLAVTSWALDVSKRPGFAVATAIAQANGG